MKRSWKIGIATSSALVALGFTLFMGYCVKHYLIDIPKELLEQAEKVDVTYIRREMPLADLIQMPTVEGNAAQDYIKALKFGYGDRKIQLQAEGRVEIYDTEARILDHILAGAQKMDCDFATMEYQTAEGIINFPTPTFSLNPLVKRPSFISALRLAKALAAKGDRYFILGEVQEALRVYESILILGHHLESCRQTRVQFMTGVAIIDIGINRLEKFYSYQGNTGRAAKAKEYKAQSEEMKTKLSRKMGEVDPMRRSPFGNYKTWMRILKEDEDAMFRREAAQSLLAVFVPYRFDHLFHLLLSGRKKVSRVLEDAMQNDEDQFVRETARNVLNFVKNKQERKTRATETQQIDLSKMFEKRAEEGATQKNDAKAHRARGAAYHATGLLDKARNEYELALELDPDGVYTFVVHNDLGELHTSEKMYDEAIAEFRKSIALKPEYITAHVNLAEAYSAKGLHDEETAELELAAYISYKAPDIYYRLARLYSLKNDRSRAIEALEKAIGPADYFGKKYIQKAKDDEDFDNIRSTPEFQRVISQ